MPTASQRWLANAALSLASVGLLLGALEVGLRVRGAAKPKMEANAPPRFIACDACGYAFGLNPDHPEISSQGLRDREFAVPKPPGVTRVLVLGDSVTYGVRVSADRAWPKVLERRLYAVDPGIEVVNAGVTAWTPFNELHFYLERGRLLEPDVVILALCLNDVADPQLHWDALGKTIREVPAESIPNPDYHEGHIRRELRLERLRDNPSLLVRTLARRWLDRRRADHLDEAQRWVAGRRWPVYLTAEDTLPIDVLLDYESAEWRWLRASLDRVAEAVRSDGAELVLAVLPLAYQIDPDYPYVPWRSFARYCEERALRCVDLLPALRREPVEDTYLLRFSGVTDVWHFTPRGHRVVAEALERALLDAGLLPVISEGGTGAPHRPRPAGPS